ncbi:hypothetical protein Tco_1427325 [Tanacetum coccineum]
MRMVWTEFRWWDRVDQWNAVKEDMHEHMEDELDDALEALWKIWQREIEDVVDALNGNRELTLFNGMTDA